MRPSVAPIDIDETIKGKTTYLLAGERYSVLLRQVAFAINDPAEMKRWRAELQDRARKREHGK